MKHRIGCILIWMYGTVATAHAQMVNNMLSYKYMNSERYYRLNYDNDFFTATDEYYTQGIHMEVVSPAMKRFPLNRLMLRPAGMQLRYGVGAEHNGYTPASISDDVIRYGDRPFAACLYIKGFMTAIDAGRKRRLASAMSVGVIGPAAGAQQMQTSIHKWLDNVTPHGWQHQIHNDLILNYEVNAEQQLFSFQKYLMADVTARVRVGTFSNMAALGVTVMAGGFSSPYDTGRSYRHRVQVYVYAHPEVNAVAYDATLQGGMLNRTSPYTITANDVQRMVVSHRTGVMIAYRNLHLDYYLSAASKSFKTGKDQAWGGIQIAFGF